MKDLTLLKTLCLTALLFSLISTSFGQSKIELERARRAAQQVKNDFCGTMEKPANRVKPQDIDILNRFRQFKDGGTWNVQDGYGSGCTNDCSLAAAARTPTSCSSTSLSLFRIPVVHRVSNTGGCVNSVPTQAEIDGQLNLMNDFFDCQDIPIELYKCTTYPNAPTSGDNSTQFEDFGCTYDDCIVENIPNVLNLYLFSNTGNGTGCNGFAYLPTGSTSPNVSVMGGGCYDGFSYTAGTINCASPNLGFGIVLIHEIGHYLGLHHTHETGSAGCDDPNATTDDCTSGDFIQDTDEDPDWSGGEIGCTGCNTGGATSNCAFNNSANTACDDYLNGGVNPNTINNIMSYNNFGGCRTMFTTCQKAKMIDALVCARGLQNCCRDIEAEFANGNDDTKMTICVGDPAPTFTALNNCYDWYDGIGAAASVITANSTSFTPPTGAGAGQVNNNAIGEYTFYLGDINEINPDCRTELTVVVIDDPGTASANGNTTSFEITNCTSATSVSLDTDATTLLDNCVVGYWITQTNPITTSVTSTATLTSSLAGASINGAVTNPVNTIIQPTGGTPINDASASFDCSSLDAGLSYYATPVLAKSADAVPDVICDNNTGNGTQTGFNGNTVDASLSDIGCPASCTPTSSGLAPTFTVTINVTTFNPTGGFPANLFVLIREGGCNTDIFSQNKTVTTAPSAGSPLTLTFTDLSFADGYDPCGDLCIVLLNFADPFTSGSPTIEFDYDLDVTYPGSPAITFPSLSDYTSCMFGTPVEITCGCCPTLTTAAPAVTVPTESTCNTTCMLTGGSIVAPTGTCPTGSTLEYATDGATFSATLPTYDQSTAVTVTTRCICTNDNSIVSPTSAVTTVPGTCDDPAAPTGVTFTDSQCQADGITISGGGFTIPATACLAGSTLTWYSNSGLTTMVGTPSYNQTGPAQTFWITCIDDNNGCESTSVQIGPTMPGACTCPTITAAPPVVITSESECVATCTLGNGVLAVPATSCVTGSSLEYSVGGGAWSTTLPTYNQMTSEAINTRCVCNIDNSMVGPTTTVNTTPGTCTDPVITVSSTDPTSCATATGTLTISGLTAAANYTISYAGLAGAPATGATVAANGTGQIVITGLTAGSVTSISVTDANGCVSNVIASEILTDPTPPTVMFAALADLCLNAGLQSALSGGTPVGGSYAGPGVTDDANGMTYSFNPATAGVGIHVITYSFTDANGCSASATDNVEVFALPTVMFTAPADLCLNAGVQLGLTGGTPAGGMYSGTGVTDDANGMTYSFDPATAGVGVHILTYSFTDANGCSASATDNVEVFDAPTVVFAAPADLCIDAGVQAGAGGGTPTGGVYGGAGVTDDANGMTYSFDPAAAGVGTHNLSYTFTTTDNCVSSTTDEIEVFAVPTVIFTALSDICINAGVQTGLTGGTPAGGIYSGMGVVDDANGMTYSFDPVVAGLGIHTLSYTFTDTNGCSSSTSDDVEVLNDLAAPADITITNSVCSGAGGILGAFEGMATACTSGTLTFYTDPAGTMGASTAPVTYNQDGPVQILYMRCVDTGSACESSVTTVGPTIPADCVYEPDFSASDPCACNDDQSANGAGDGTFSETVSITGPSFGNICVGPGSTGLVGASIGDIICEESPGMYSISFNHVDGVGYSLEIVDCITGDPILDVNDNPIVIGNTCYYPVIEFTNPGPFCSTAPAVDLNTTVVVDNDGYTNANGVITFTPATNFDPSTAVNGVNTVTITYTPNMMLGDNVDATAPVCPVELEVEIVVNTADCGTFPWGGNE